MLIFSGYPLEIKGRTEKLRQTGIDIIGHVSWGTHFCQFYQTKEDLIDILAPYFKAGLENNEFCMWVTSEPLNEKDARESLAKVLPDLEIYLNKGQIEIIPHDEWYLKDGIFDQQRVLNGWVNKLNQALVKGYDGLRLTCNTFWLEKRDWGNFTDYEREVNDVIGKYRMLAICTYSLKKCGANEVIDVVQNHQFALIKREGRWELIESSDRKRIEEDLSREIDEHKRTEDSLRYALEESRQHQAEILALLEGSRAVLKYHDFKGAARSIFDSCKNLIGATSGYVALLNEDGTENEVLFLDSGGLPCTVDPKLPMPIRGLRGEAYHNIKTVHHNDFHRSEWMKFMPEGHVRLDNVLFAPMVVEGKAVGLLGIANKPEGFTENDARMASAFAELAAIALLNKWAEENLYRARGELEIRVQERTAELARSHELLESAFSNINVLIAHMDRDFNFIRVNKSYAQADEREPKFFVGKNHFDLYPNKENETIFRKVVETGEPVFFYEKPFEYAEHPERGVTYWDWSLQPMKSVNGEIEGLILTLIDRTQHHRAQEKLLKSERKYRMLIEQASDGIALLDQQLNIIDVNSMVCQLSGFSREELLSLNAKDLIPPGDLDTKPLRLNEVLAGGIVFDERRLLRKDGTLIAVEVSAKMLDDGKIQTIVRDITERKEAEEQTRITNVLLEFFAKKSTKKEYLDSVVQVIHEWSGCRCVGIRVINDQGYIPYECTIGFSLDFLRLENMLSLKKDICACIRAITGEFEPQDTDVITPARSFYLNNSSNFLNGLTEKEKARFRGNCIRNGFMSIAIIPIRYREQVRGAIHMTDEREGMVPLKKLQFIESIAPLIGEAMHRFKIEETLRRNESHLSEAQRIARLGNWVWDVQNNELFWSDEVYRIFGLTPQQFGATYDEFLNYVHPKDRELVKKAVNEALYGRPYNIEHRIILPDGAVRIVHEKGEVTFGESGEPVQMLGTVQNITDSKKVEEELKKSSEQLRNLSAHLQSVREEERTNIAREIHDELGQVLTALKIDVSMLANKLHPDSKLLEKTESMRKRIDETIQTVKRICTELRPTILDHFGLSAAVEWQVEEFESRTGIKCDVFFEPREIILDQDLTTSVFRIFQEALTNVVRHANATEVKVSLRLKDGNVMLEVKDNGKGITQKEFSNPQSFGIIGIKERTIFFGGDVKINGIRDKGTTLTVCIPLRKKEELHDKNIDSR